MAHKSLIILAAGFVGGLLFAWNDNLVFDVAIDRAQAHVETESLLDEQLVCAKLRLPFGPCTCEVRVSDYKE